MLLKFSWILTRVAYLRVIHEHILDYKNSLTDLVSKNPCFISCQNAIWTTLPCLIGYYQDRCWNSLPMFFILPKVFQFFQPRLLFRPYSIFATLSYYSALGFLFLPPQAIIQPQVFHSCQPLLLFHLKQCNLRLSFSALGFYSYD